ncbi:response regulator [Streptomyces celluloflavus]|uniref:response regulator n=1 Tax=Streptomyces celluloflavus TaxID=58344 RepID=UPI0036DBED30
MSEMNPLPEELSDEARALAIALRELFRGLNVSLRRYSSRRHRNAATFSRYFSGRAVPPWDVVMDLLADLAEHRGKPATQEAMDLLRRLHQAAIATTSSPKHAVEILERQLADADRTARSTTAHSDVIGEALLDRQHRIADLEVRLTHLESEWSAERARADALEANAPDIANLLRERDALSSEVTRLTNELEAVQVRHSQAEERCKLLERQIDTIEEQRQEPLETTAGEPNSPCLPKVLVVDDQPENLLAMTAVLDGLDQEIVAVSSGREALKALLDHDDFAVLLLDVQMPEMDGYETAAQIKRRARHRDLPIIFLTAMSIDSEHSARAYSAGAVDYIAKPFDPWALRAKVAVFTEIFHERRQRER